MKSTTAQAATRKLLEAQGFSVADHDCKTVLMKRGKDFRLILQNGTQKRAALGVL